MKRHIFLYTLTLLSTLSLTGCLDETLPQDGMTGEQVKKSENSLQVLSNGISRQLLSYGGDDFSCGYGGMMLCRDVAVGDLPVYASGYDYFYEIPQDSYLSEIWNIAYDWWEMYSGLVSRANLVLRAAPDDADATPKQRALMGNALCYRALAYLDMTRLYEYRTTGFEALDTEAQDRGIMGLTVPLITENTTEKQARKNPRMPFPMAYRFILTDLNRAATLLSGSVRDNVGRADEAVAHGLLARLWLEMGTRFERFPSDLQTQLQGENADSLKAYDRLEITTAAECFAQAAEQARQAITLSGEPLTEKEWHNSETGFNSSCHAWMLTERIGRDDITDDNANWKNFISFISPEAGFGIANTTYNAMRMIDAALYATIDSTDWRRATWIDPQDAGDGSKAYKYATILSSEAWSALPAYTGLKFHPAAGGENDYLSGSAIDIPLMRVEEMYLIEAEALAHSAGLEAGCGAMENFIRTYRSTATEDGDLYRCPSGSMEDFTAEVLRQKRIEFWGEGITLFDYKRLGRAIVTDYEGTNHIDAYRFHFSEGVTAPRLNFCFPTSESSYNKALINNPDPSGYHNNQAN